MTVYLFSNSFTCSRTLLFYSLIILVIMLTFSDLNVGTGLTEVEPDKYIVFDK